MAVAGWVITRPYITPAQARAWLMRASMHECAVFAETGDNLARLACHFLADLHDAALATERDHAA